MLKRLLPFILALGAVAPAYAVDYTDIWYLPSESGWGVNVVQSGTFMFVTFFIYGPDRKPTWYTAQLTKDAAGNFNGPLFATTGTFYGSAWNTQDLSIGQVGTASFQPSGVASAKLVYTVTTPAALAASVSKSIQRQSLTAIPIAGTYVGGQSGAYSGCTSSTDNFAYTDPYTLTVTQGSGSAATLQFAYDSGLSCTLSGTLVQTGQLLGIAAAHYVCSDGLDTTAALSEIRATSLGGLEGRLAAGSVAGGCRETAAFGGPPQ
jgi:hypothetical protein